MVKAKRYLGILNEYYGKLLTKYQSELIRLYYDMDMSLSEIGEELNVTRQAVKNVLSRAEERLNDFEEKLGLYKKLNDVTDKLKDLGKQTVGDVKAKIDKIIDDITEI